VIRVPTGVSAQIKVPCGGSAAGFWGGYGTFWRLGQWFQLGSGWFQVVPGGSRFWVSSGSNLHKALLHSDSCALAHVTISYEYDAFAVGDTTLCMFFEINCMNYQARTLAAF